MQTRLPKSFLSTQAGAKAESILRSCVHCGFCNATCPTYQLTFDELEGPRGRIYLIKTMFEQGTADKYIQQHLDNCLTCKACETTCPSNVDYHSLLDIARPEIEKIKRPLAQRWLRKALLTFVPYPDRFKWLLKLGQLFRPILPRSIAVRVPFLRAKRSWPKQDHPRRVLIATGCVQAACVPSTDAALAQLLDVMGIAATQAKGCCGAMAQHLGDMDHALATARSNIDRWWPEVEKGAEAIVISASGCAPQLKEYGQLLEQDEHYKDRARKLSAMVRDPVEMLENHDWKVKNSPHVAFHSPCSLVHGTRLDQSVRELLERAGFKLAATVNDGSCCGSAGAYSLINPVTSQQLLKAKLADLCIDEPEVVATANIGCQLHLEAGRGEQVLHWVELLAANAEGVVSEGVSDAKRSE